jgi:hypothetical protein
MVIRTVTVPQHNIPNNGSYKGAFTRLAQYPLQACEANLVILLMQLPNKILFQTPLIKGNRGSCFFIVIVVVDCLCRIFCVGCVLGWFGCLGWFLGFVGLKLWVVVDAG